MPGICDEMFPLDKPERATEAYRAVFGSGDVAASYVNKLESEIDRLRAVNAKLVGVCRKAKRALEDMQDADLWLDALTTTSMAIAEAEVLTSPPSPSGRNRPGS